MNQVEAVQRLKRLGTHGFETRDAAAVLDVTAANANMILRRLAHSGLLIHVSRGRWLQSADVPPFALPELISAPYPAYVSLQSALFHHGLIEQIPAVIYAVTLGRPRRVRTPLGSEKLKWLRFSRRRPVPWLSFGEMHWLLPTVAFRVVRLRPKAGKIVELPGEIEA
ncbi:MAG: hypothetical protein WDO56_09500 [Gammaproteobacteria bacterium]